MKLFRKIYLQVVLGMLALAAVLLIYLLWESARRSLSDSRDYGEERLLSGIQQFKSEIAGTELHKSAETVRRTGVSMIFQNVFGSRAVLLKEGEEQLNLSPYTFDYARLMKEWKLAEGKPKRSSSSVYVSGPQQVEDRVLFVYYSPGLNVNFPENSVVYWQDVTDIYVRTQSLLFRGLACTVLLLALTGIGLWHGIYRALQPMLELKQTAAAIADGAYESRAAVQSGDEIGELVGSFNRMAEKVEEHMETLRETNERQRQLLGALAHELKTPLTAIIGYADTLLTVRLGEKNRERALGYIRSEGRRLSRLSEKMLELTGLYESGESSLELQKTEVAKLMRQLLSLTEFRRKEQGIRLEAACMPQTLTKEMDQDLVMSLLMNLVDNACKASERDSVIRVTADESGITVADKGRGIPESEVARVTEPFYMVNKSRARSAGSVGLGLALCSQIAAMHGWTLTLTSEEGSGTRVTVRW